MRNKEMKNLMRLFIALGVFLLVGCGTVKIEPQILKMEYVLIYLYKSKADVEIDYRNFGGTVLRIGEIRGFYSHILNSIHCIKWDYYCLGHEMMHALDYKSEPSLIVEGDRRWHFNHQVFDE